MPKQAWSRSSSQVCQPADDGPEPGLAYYWIRNFSVDQTGPSTGNLYHGMRSQNRPRPGLAARFVNLRITSSSLAQHIIGLGILAWTKQGLGLAIYIMEWNVKTGLDQV